MKKIICKTFSLPCPLLSLSLSPLLSALFFPLPLPLDRATKLDFFKQIKIIQY